MKVTYLGTTVLLFDDGVDQVLFDCHFTRPSLLKCGVGKLDSSPSICDKTIDMFEIRRLKAIFVSHTHHDHVLDAPYTALACGARIYGSASTLNVARGNGVMEKQLEWFGHGSEFTIGAYHIRVLRSVHSRPTRFNDNLGETIDQPLKYPAGMSAFKEGGSFDFLVEHQGKTYLIRPSYNFLEHQLDGLKADVLFAGITGLAKDSEEHRKQFYAETIAKVRAKQVIPVHWDNFFAPLYGPVKGMPKLFEDTDASLAELAAYCKKTGVICTVLQPLKSVEL